MNTWYITTKRNDSPGLHEYYTVTLNFIVNSKLAKKAYISSKLTNSLNSCDAICYSIVYMAFSWFISKSLRGSADLIRSQACM